MPWTVDIGGGGTRLTLTGIVDIFEAATLHAALRDLVGEPREVVVDASACAGLDSSALQLLLAFREALNASGGRLVIEAGDGPAARLLGRFGLL
jgi:anti-anti-sigma regulatory factor